MSGFDVELGRLDSHAAEAGRLAQRVGEAKDAAGEILQDSTAFGILCQFVVPFIAQGQNDALQSLVNLESTMRSIEIGLSKTSKSYKEADDAARAVFEAILKEL